MIRNLQLMIKPASSRCNINCGYCFYNETARNREISDYGGMKEETIKEIIRKASEFCGSGTCGIGFQGGEPMLRGIEFYKKIMDYIKEEKMETNFVFTIQTNGILINEEWAEFLRENNFLTGISLDGTETIHNSNRKNHSGQGTFNEVMNSVELLKQYEADFNILTVVTKELAENIEEVYRFYKKNDFHYLQFIPYIETEENMKSEKYMLSAEVYGDFLNRLFDLWYDDLINDRGVSIRYFDNIVGLFLGYPYEACDMRGVCSCQNIIESDGSIYPCDFYVYDDYKLGNINENTFEEIIQSKKTEKFIMESLVHNKECMQCEYRNLCCNGCKKHRDNNNKNRFCETYKEFFGKHTDKFYKIREMLIKGSF
ncbi:anaerobic sulfatase maturase [Sebaldella sp. S0638]|uniref:anaerobic sulfatase maturase n=1 Tax=Sebaldella sp. S0638 TaxID=2957809 RepID=UPI00209C8B15|nr:anaerobic sulfatase maturase [Sebaldella sp. S0638]MCP1222780.1 anaerobic sulfatase maturase [Sebaldella sp. S0638]